MGKLISLIIFLASALLQGTNLHAQKLYGKVVNMDTILSKATLKAYQNEILKGQTITDSTGYYSLDLVDTGYYRMVICYLNKSDTFGIHTVNLQFVNQERKFPDHISFFIGEAKHMEWSEFTFCPCPQSTFDIDEPGTRTFYYDDINHMPH